MMKIIILLSILLLTGCENVNTGILTDAVNDGLGAASMTSKDVLLLAEESRKDLDSQAVIADEKSEYYRRLFRLIDQNETFQNVSFNFKIYISNEINAFALPDGSIRIYSGLMDFLTDDELVFVIGHEMGHVINEDTLDKLRVAYGTRAVQKGLSSIKGDVGEVSASWVGDLSNALINSQFSQQEEREADDYGLYYLTVRGIDRNASVSALMKLATLGADHSFLSTHPEPEARANRLHERITNTNEAIIYPKTLTDKGRDALAIIKEKYDEVVN